MQSIHDLVGKPSPKDADSMLVDELACFFVAEQGRRVLVALRRAYLEARADKEMPLPMTWEQFLTDSLQAIKARDAAERLP